MLVVEVTATMDDSRDEMDWQRHHHDHSFTATGRPVVKEDVL